MSAYYPLYTPPLTTLAHVRQHRRIAADKQADDTLLSAFIAEASADFIMALQRVPHPHVATKAFGAEHLDNSLDLALRDDLLAVTSITNGDGASITTGYNLRPNNVYPKTTVELTSSGAQYWNILYRESSISIAGLWGYSPHYATGAWKGITTLNGPIVSTTATTVTLTSGALVDVGGHLLIDSEQMPVTAVSGNSVAVERGANGTTAATHLTAASVSQYAQLADIKAAVRDMVVFKYLSKDTVGERVQIFDGGTVLTQDLPANVGQAIARHKRRQAIRAV